MARKIIIFGNPDKTELGFPMPGDLREYISGDIFASNRGRYRYTLCRDAEVIVLSRGGLAFGHFEIASRERPTDDDRREYPRVKQVYLVRKSTLYEIPVKLSLLGIRYLQFGKWLSEEEFESILHEAGQTREFADVAFAIAEEMPVGTYPEGAASHILVNAYERNPAAVRACKEHYGTRCQVCDLELGERYGDIGQGFIHVHHLKQLSEVGEQYEVDPVADLRPVCPNCHAMLHRETPPLSIDELKLRMSR